MDTNFGTVAASKNALEDESSENDSEHYRQKYKSKWSDDSGDDSNNSYMGNEDDHVEPEGKYF